MYRILLCLSVLCAALFSLCGGAKADVPAAGQVVVDETFDNGRFDPTVWEQRISTGRGTGYVQGIGATVRVENGALILAQDAVDRGGAVLTRPIAPVPGSVLVVSKRTRLHFAGNHFLGATNFMHADTLGQVAHAAYYHYEAVNAFVLGPRETGPRLDPLWDQWFDEEITYDPATGEVTLSVNGGNPIRWKGGATTVPLRVGLTGYGWGTGHRQEVDRIRISWRAKGAPQQPTTVPARALVSWGPSPEFSAVGVAPRAPYGARTLTARYSRVPMPVDTEVRVVWRRDNSPQPVADDRKTMRAGTEHVDGWISVRTGVLAPGSYTVAFLMGNATVAAGEIQINPMPALGGEAPAEVYMKGLQALQLALQAVDASNAPQAEKQALTALPLVAGALHAAPNLPDIVPVHEITQAVVAIGRMYAVAQQRQAPAALDWAQRAVAHARGAQAEAQDEKLKGGAKQIADTIEKALPDLRRAAGQ